jgi:thiamine-phosphate pyrophosphorylase
MTVLWKEKVFKNFQLYAVTDLVDTKKAILRKVAQAFDGGVDIVQLRSKMLSDNALISIGRDIRKIATQKRKLFFVNDRPDIALVLDADGLHIGQDDMPVPHVRKLFRQAGKSLFLGKSTHSLAQALQTAEEDVDYIGVGPIFATPTKKDYIPVGLNLVNRVKSRVSKPFVCIGGINQENIHTVIDAGALRVAVVRAIFSSSNPREAARALKRSITSL